MNGRLPPSRSRGQGLTLPRTATTIIAAVTAFFSLGILLFNRVELAASLMGFVPARLSGDFNLTPAIPAFLTPLSATIVHGNLLHLAMNLILLVWCGRAVERIIGAGSTVVLYLAGALFAAAAQFLVDPHSLVPMIGASGAISALIGAFALTFGRPEAAGEVGCAQPLAQRCLAAGGVGHSAVDDGFSDGPARRPARDSGAYRRIPGGAGADSAVAAVAVS